ncbi:AAA family ATPase [Flammeovirga aprica]|uniref:AAA family ATPase n=1 Tax=Flammeovirga aprica JL-4 TaxID=694437 RepID=A0A7X9RZV3_9BACT|nr:AAA family ATPase [Flammeovirga aprica]NME71750.1 AAA family ATPase [Flammeovirga aprica JL-4]
MQAIIFTGIQASGKSTFYKNHFFNTHVRISMDLLNTRNKEKQFLETCFNTNAKFVVDNTNPSKTDREKYIKWAKENSYEVIGYYFSTTIKEALQRNNLREGKEKIPEVGVRSCYRKMEIPSLSEGFDKLYFVKMKDDGFTIEDWKDEV